MRNTRVWERACGLTRTVVEDVDFDDAAEAVVVSVRPEREGPGPVWALRPAVASLRPRRGPASVAGARSRDDEGVPRGRRTAGPVPQPWRRRSPRCRGPATAPATPGTSMTWPPGSRSGPRRARCASCCGWRGARSGRSSPGSTPTSTRRVDRLEGLRRIGIDEISYKRGHRYLIVVVDHDTGRAGVGRPGPQRRRPARVLRPARRRSAAPQLTHVTR